MSDFAETAFPGQPSPAKEANFNRELEDSSSLNDDSSVASGELLLHPVKGADLDIRRTNSEQAIGAAKESHHRRWLSEDIKGNFNEVIIWFSLCLMLFNEVIVCFLNLAYLEIYK